MLRQATFEFFPLPFFMLAPANVPDDDDHAGRRSFRVPHEVAVYSDIEDASIGTQPAVFIRARHRSLTLQGNLRQCSRSILWNYEVEQRTPQKIFLPSSAEHRQGNRRYEEDTTFAVCDGDVVGRGMNDRSIKPLASPQGLRGKLVLRNLSLKFSIYLF